MALINSFIHSYTSALSLSRLLASLMLFCRLLSRIFWSSFFSLQKGKKTQESQAAKKCKGLLLISEEHMQTAFKSAGSMHANQIKGFKNVAC